MPVIELAAVAVGGALVGAVATVLARRPRRALPDQRLDDLAYARLVLDRATVGHAVLDVDGHVLFANERCQELGVVRAGIADPRIVAATARAAVSQDPVDIDLGAVEPPVALDAPRRNPVSVLAVVRDIGDGMILVAATDETEAQRLESVRRDFVANVSHELKTPVAAIGLLAEAVVDAADEPEAVRRFADRLLRESSRLGALVGELIVLSRLQGADPLPELSVVEVDGVVTEAAARTAMVAEKSGISVDLGASSGELVLGDRTMLVNALTNLIDNAVHYSPTGTSVSISTRVRDGQVEISVTDRGIGIAPEHQDRVFERFFRVDPARSRVTGGTGLGLAIVKHTAANHGGSAVLWSKPGTGSTFTLRLPQYRPESARPIGDLSAGPESVDRAGAANLNHPVTGRPPSIATNRGAQ